MIEKAHPTERDFKRFTIHDLRFTIHDYDSLLKGSKIVVAICVLNSSLASRVVTCGWKSFEATFVDGLPTASANPVTALLHPQQRLINIRDQLRAAFSESQGDLLVEIEHGEIHSVLNTV